MNKAFFRYAGLAIAVTATLCQISKGAENSKEDFAGFVEKTLKARDVNAWLSRARDEIEKINQELPLEAMRELGWLGAAYGKNRDVDNACKCIERICQISDKNANKIDGIDNVKDEVICNIIRGIVEGGGTDKGMELAKSKLSEYKNEAIGAVAYELAKIKIKDAVETLKQVDDPDRTRWASRLICTLVDENRIDDLKGIETVDIDAKEANAFKVFIKYIKMLSRGDKIDIKTASEEEKDAYEAAMLHWIINRCSAGRLDDIRNILEKEGFDGKSEGLIKGGRVLLKKKDMKNAEYLAGLLKNEIERREKNETDKKYEYYARAYDLSGLIELEHGIGNDVSAKEDLSKMIKVLKEHGKDIPELFYYDYLGQLLRRQCWFDKSDEKAVSNVGKIKNESAKPAMLFYVAGELASLGKKDCLLKLWEIADTPTLKSRYCIGVGVGIMQSMDNMSTQPSSADSGKNTTTSSKPSE